MEENVRVIKKSGNKYTKGTSRTTPGNLPNRNEIDTEKVIYILVFIAAQFTRAKI